MITDFVNAEIQKSIVLVNPLFVSTNKNKRQISFYAYPPLSFRIIS